MRPDSRMKDADSRMAAVLLAAALLLGAAGCTGGQWTSARPASLTGAQKTSIQVKTLSEVTNVETQLAVEREDHENLHIEQALCVQGYYRDDIPLPYDLQDFMQSACDTYGVPYSLALAVCETESSFDPNAMDGACAGYMQINSCNFDKLGAMTGYDPQSPDGNIVCGVALLGELLNTYGDTEKALCCYNAGEAGANEHYFSQGITSTKYSRTVLERQRVWQAVLDH